MSLIFTNFGWGSIQQFGLKGTTVIIYFILARLLGAEAIGLISFAYALLAITELVITKGLPEAIVQGEELEQDQVNSLFLYCIFWATGTFFCFQVLAYFYQFFDRSVSVILASMSFLLFLRPIVVLQTAFARRKFKFKEITKITVIASLVSDSIAIILAFVLENIWALVISVYIKFIIMNFFFARLNVFPFLHFNYEQSQIKELVVYSNEVFKTKVLSFITTRADVLIIGSFLGMNSLGYYSMVMKIATAFEEVLMQPFCNVMLNVFSRLKKSLNELMGIFYSSANILTTCSLPFYFILGFYGNVFFTSLLGDKWEVGSALYFFIAFQMAVRTISYLNYPFLYGIGSVKYVTYMNAINLILTLIILIPLSNYGIDFVAMGIFVRACVGLFIGFSFMSKIPQFNLGEYLYRIRGPILSFPLIYLAVYLAKAYPLPDGFHFEIVPVFILLLTYLLLILLVNKNQVFNDFRSVKLWKVQADI